MNSSNNSGRIDLLWVNNDDTIHFPNIPLNTFKIINKLSEIDKDYDYILHFYSMLI